MLLWHLNLLWGFKGKNKWLDQVRIHAFPDFWTSSWCYFSYFGIGKWRLTQFIKKFSHLKCYYLGYFLFKLGYSISHSLSHPPDIHFFNLTCLCYFMETLKFLTNSRSPTVKTWLQRYLTCIYSFYLLIFSPTLGFLDNPPLRLFP